jgi:hypothetical protein
VKNNPHKKEQVVVAVSPSRERLRNAQRQLNWLLWSSELAYGVVLTTADARLVNQEERVSVALASVESLAWFPNYKGGPHYDASVRSFREQLARNSSILYPQLLVAWFSHFETYLEERVRPIRGGHASWGPLTRTLAMKELQTGLAQVRPRTVALADLVRELRNEAVHSGLTTVETADHARIVKWKEQTESILRDNWRSRTPGKLVDTALDFFIGLAQRQRLASARSLPLDHFYFLYVLSNLDKLAFEIEEALIPNGFIPPGRIRRWRNEVRRSDLIVDSLNEMNPSDHQMQAGSPPNSALYLGKPGCNVGRRLQFIHATLARIRWLAQRLTSIPVKGRSSTSRNCLINADSENWSAAPASPERRVPNP